MKTFLENSFNLVEKITPQQSEILKLNTINEAEANRGGQRWEDVDFIELPNGEMIDMKKLLKDQQLAKAALNTRLPHIGILAEKIRFIYTFEVDTQATDGYNVFANPKFTNDLTIEGKMFVMAHELMHCLLNHIRRAKAIDAMNMKGNIAADYEVNQTLVDLGLVTEKVIKDLGGYIDKKWSRKPFEQIFNQMENPSKPNQQQQNGGGSGMQGTPPPSSGGSQNSQGGGQSGSNQNQQNQSGNQGQQNSPGGNSGGSGGGNQQNNQGNSGSGSSQGQSGNQQGSQQQGGSGGQGQPVNQSNKKKQGNQGSGSGGQGNGSGNKGNKQQGDIYTDANGNTVRKVTQKDLSSQGSGNQRSVNGSDMMSKDEGDELAKKEGYEKEGGSQDQVNNEWEKHQKDIANKMAGSKEGSAEKFLSDLLKSFKMKDDGTWKKKLRDIVGRSISPESKRRGFAHQNTLASQARLALNDFTNYDNLDYIGAFVDTSGSMSQDFLTKCLTEVCKIADAKKPNGIMLAQFDTRITSLERYTSSQEFQKKFKFIKIKGGGGTDIKECFDLPKTTNKEHKKLWPKSILDLVVIFTDGYLDTYKRPHQLCRNLIWVIIGNPGFELKKSETDANTKIIYITEEQAKKW